MRSAKKNRIILAAVATTSLLGQAVYGVDYTWSTLAGGSQSWDLASNWGGVGFPSTTSDRANLSVGLTGNLTVNTPVAGATVGTLIIGGTGGIVTTNVAGGTLSLNSRIISQGTVGAINTVSAPVRFTGSPTIQGSNSVHLSGNISQGSGGARTITSNLDAGLTLTLGASDGSSVLNVYDETSIGTSRVIAVNIADNTNFVLNALLDDGTITTVNFGTFGDSGAANNATFFLNKTQTVTGNGKINRQRYVVGADNAFGNGGQIQASNNNVNNAWGGRIESNNDARFLTNSFLVSNNLFFTGSNSLEIKGYLTQGNNRTIGNNLAAGKTLTLTGFGAGTLAGVAIGCSNLIADGTRTFIIDGPGHTIVNGKVVANIVEYGTAVTPTVRGDFRKRGSGTVELNNAGNTISGPINADGGLLVFGANGSWGTGTITANSTGGIWYGPGSADPGFLSTGTNGFMFAVQAASTGALSLPDTELATSFDFTSGSLSNAANMSIGVRGSKTYTGTVTATGTFGYNWGHHLGTMTINGNNKMTGANNVTYKNGGTVIVTGTHDYTGVTNLNSSNMSTSEVAMAVTGSNANVNVVYATALEINQLGNAGGASALGNTSNAASNLVFNGGILRYTGAATSTDRLFLLSANGGTIESSGTGTLDFLNPGTIDLNTGTGNANTTRTVTLGGSYSGGTNTFATILANETHVGADTNNYTDALAVTKAGAGHWQLTGANTYTGLTKVTGGTLSFGGSAIVQNGTSVEVDGATAVLDLGSQTPTLNTVTLSNGGTIIGTGPLNITGALNLGGGTTTLAITGTAGIGKVGTGTVTITDDYALAGVCTITAGTLEVNKVANGGVASPLGAGTNSATHLVFNGGALRYIGTGHSTDRLFTVNNTGTIDASGSGSLQFTNTGTIVTVGNRTLNLTGTNTGANTIAGILENSTGTLAISKSGTGAWTLTGANTYTGGTTVTAGTLTVTSPLPSNRHVVVNGATAVLNVGSLQHDLNTATLTNGGQILGTGSLNVATFNVDTGTLTATLIGGGSFTKFGPNEYTLGANHEYSGKTAVTGGTLNFSGSPTQIVGGRDVEVNGSTAVMNFGALNPIVGIATLTNGSMLGTGSMTVNNRFYVTQGTTALPIAGGGGVTKLGSTTFTVSNTNSYTGSTQIDAGVLAVSTLPNGGVNGPIGASTSDAGNLVLNGGTLRYTGTGDSTDRLFAMSASSGIESSGTGALQFTNTADYALGGVTLTLGGTNTGANTIAGSLSVGGGLSVTKSGAGKWILAGANSYTGTTTVSAGTLQLNKDSHSPVLLGTESTGAIVNTALVLDYSGGGVNPAVNVGTLLAATYADADYATGVIRSTAATGTLSLGWKDTGSAVIILKTLDGDADLNGKVNTVDFNMLAGGFGASGKVWSEGNFDHNGTIDSVDFGLLAATYGMTFALPSEALGASLGGPALGAVVPEPASVGLIGMALAGLVARRRR